MIPLERARHSRLVRQYADAAWDWVQTSRRGRVLQALGRACNLVNERGEVLSLVTTALGPGPFSWVIEGELGEISAESPLLLQPTLPALTLGPYHISLTGAQRWSARPDWAALRHSDPAAWPRAAWTLPGAEAALTALTQGVATGAADLCRGAVRQLAGRGPGLTPAGDDYVLGALYALWVWQPASPLIQLLVNLAAPRTTTLSAAFLRAAARGEATWHWHALAQGAPNAAAAICRVGASSGAAMWRGFVECATALTDSAESCLLSPSA